MHYEEIKTVEQQVNKKGSKLWIKMNDNSRASINRNNFVTANGGFFKPEGRYFIWIPPEVEQNGYWLLNVITQQKEFFTNMGEWAEKHGMTSVKVCELLNGKRKTYKGWTASELRDVKETKGSHQKVKIKKSKKVAITKNVTFQNKETKEIVNVSNISQFAKQNNLNSKELYKVARGAAKSHKNLILYVPISISENFGSDK
jgi:hypothetical protein